MKFIILLLAVVSFSAQANEKIGAKFELSLVRVFKKVSKNKYTITEMGQQATYKIKIGSSESYFEINYPEVSTGEEGHGENEENFNPYQLMAVSGLNLHVKDRSTLHVSGALSYGEVADDQLDVNVPITANADLDIFQIPSMKSTISQEEILRELKMIIQADADLKNYKVKKTFKQLVNKCILVEKTLTCKETSVLKLQATRK